MNDKVKESFSAWLDDEANDMDMQRLLNSLESGQDPIEQFSDLAKTRRLGAKNEFEDISRSIQEAIAIEQPVATTETLSKKYPVYLVASFALAAVLIMPVALKNPWVKTQYIALSQANQQTKVDQTELVVASKERLNSYMQLHLRQASLSSGKVSLPFNSSMTTGG